MKERRCILFWIVTYCCLFAEPNNSGQNATTCTSRYLRFSGKNDLILLGHEYRNVTGVSLIRCGNLCLSNTRCLSINYWERVQLCKLNGASASQFPQALAGSSGGYYYGPEGNVSCSTEKRTQQAFKEELDNDPQIFRSQESFLSADLTDAREHCAQCGMQLCSLAQLKAAYDTGYRNDNWGLIDIQGRDAKSTLCGSYVNRPGECFHRDEEDITRSAIPNTPRAVESNSVYCCSPLS